MNRPMGSKSWIRYRTKAEIVPIEIVPCRYIDAAVSRTTMSAEACASGRKAKSRMFTNEARRHALTCAWLRGV
ncbi:MAG: hypothetical protein E6G33_02395 [Actinobacteria bacterium]|nr:MAG: hypothetical protein E6G33_02395 [Actinomycetota bacterium]